MAKKKSKTTPRAMSIAEKRVKAAELRIQGLNFSEIAKQVGYANPSGAYKAVVEVMASAERETGTELLELELQRLDEMLQSVWEGARKGILFNVDRVLKISEQRAKLLGLGPQKLELSGPGGGPIETAQAGLVILPPEDPESVPAEPAANGEPDQDTSSTE